jgi:hypothetical protein
VRKGTLDDRSWPIGPAAAAARHGRLLGVNLPAARPLRQSRFGAPRAAARGWRRINDSHATISAAVKGPLPRRRACRRARRGAWPRVPRLPARWRAAPGSSPASEALHRDARGARCRRCVPRPPDWDRKQLVTLRKTTQGRKSRSEPLLVGGIARLARKMNKYLREPLITACSWCRPRGSDADQRAAAFSAFQIAAEYPEGYSDARKRGS